MRRTPDGTALSPVTEIRPISPVRFTWVPPQSSTDQPSALLAAPRAPVLPIDTTRTSSPYFSPNSARAPASRASSTAISRVVTSPFSSTTSLAMSSIAAQFVRRDRLVDARSRSAAGPARPASRAARCDRRAPAAAPRAANASRNDWRGSRSAWRDRPRAPAPCPASACPARPCRDARTDRRPSSGCR